MTQPRDVTSPRESANRFARGRSQPPHGTRGTRPRRALALLLAVLLVLQGALVLGGRSADAAETQDGDSVYLTVGDVIWYGGNDAMGTARMSVNGEVAYCSDPANGTPSGPSPPSRRSSSTDTAARALTRTSGERASGAPTPTGAASSPASTGTALRSQTTSSTSTRTSFSPTA